MSCFGTSRTGRGGSDVVVFWGPLVSTYIHRLRQVSSAVERNARRDHAGPGVGEGSQAVVQVVAVSGQTRPGQLPVNFKIRSDTPRTTFFCPLRASRARPPRPAGSLEPHSILL